MLCCPNCCMASPASYRRTQLPSLAVNLDTRVPTLLTAIRTLAYLLELPKDPGWWRLPEPEMGETRCEGRMWSHFVETPPSLTRIPLLRLSSSQPREFVSAFR